MGQRRDATSRCRAHITARGPDECALNRRISGIRGGRRTDISPARQEQIRTKHKRTVTERVKCGRFKIITDRERCACERRDGIWASPA